MKYNVKFETISHFKVNIDEDIWNDESVKPLADYIDESIDSIGQLIKYIIEEINLTTGHVPIWGWLK